MSEPLGGLWYKGWQGLLLAYFTLGNSLRIRGRQNLPKTGPALLIDVLTALCLPYLDFLEKMVGDFCADMKVE